ncbi:tRNA (adenosine(37)-N6)-threonylcarbamoyltransferase complex dimerization subunit type 1 TsaB [Reichenbachiella agarivorans]|uniref:tRNA (Adenosine(37)-N6)-threonylcarbamoyltransferase complex dimerization subunit type 1 TsaB n=1 Tax=Reichenbachiella agarivorans TaxID=2979464 RepID=A0ABY6CTR3_9BACT|nr:tRNA (adenosine(37)-N6)-threonylcarbamoyltransferase complex dimerization subunit type 1 TsaB [Reichenbachiella agarivorans]UXP33912.1 tRNA (adenosine(37)-N6)-threonylcarbamoyltransferase complex dimerization subunit type 1 TsaB [Reichenbachiella agarivorans]
MAIILSIDTSTKSGSVALVQNQQVIGSQQYNIDKSHSSLLHVMIDQLMTNTGISLKEVDAIAISEGPGSYTGLRIGTSAAKGLCYSLDIPLVAVNTLEGMAYQVHKYAPQVDMYAPMIDARRMEVYTALFNAKFECVSETEPMIINETSFAKELEGNKILFFGDGAAKCQASIQHPNALFIGDVHPCAVDMGILGERKYDQSLFENVVSFEPFYLKEFRLATAKK